ncbi:MAG: type II toxin-antitoxin system RelE family toxin [Caldisericaceae bacterium]
MAFAYRVFQTDEFAREFRKLGPQVQKLLDNAIREILFNRPYSSKVLKENLKGKRSLRVGNYRIIFAICEECRKENYVQLNGCKDCKKHGTNDIIMFTCGPRSKVYEEY